jgi:hypothetical protein
VAASFAGVTAVRLGGSITFVEALAVAAATGLAAADACDATIAEAAAAAAAAVAILSAVAGAAGGGGGAGLTSVGRSAASNLFAAADAAEGLLAVAAGAGATARSTYCGSGSTVGGCLRADACRAGATRRRKPQASAAPMKKAGTISNSVCNSSAFIRNSPAFDARRLAQALQDQSCRPGVGHDGAPTTFPQRLHAIYFSSPDGVHDIHPVMNPMAPAMATQYQSLISR